MQLFRDVKRAYDPLSIFSASNGDQSVAGGHR